MDGDMYYLQTILLKSGFQGSEVNLIAECLWIDDSHEIDEFHFVFDSDTDFTKEITELTLREIPERIIVEVLETLNDWEFFLVNHFADVLENAFFEFNDRIESATVTFLALNSVNGCIATRHRWSREEFRFSNYPKIHEI